ncbi:hypothetical protein HELRODRAFT_90717 [Helobdella robusta]|uniref:Uncharacterized protein n=1 Tax=Helobdella robusta TaxID=6412 RepID=T1G7U9_HELRO|nr:hypothetical protein HELRODRAFT_90717 [Helobdella robusta]ESN90919.1 hypothetical protein HELRODRAFT_90717 [Helobdella robusta]
MHILTEFDCLGTRKLSMLEEENRELNIASARREESLKQTNLRLEEKINEGLMMQRQIDNMMLEARKMKDHESNRMTSADQANQVQMLEMECQLNQLRHEVNKLKREKEEAERRLNQRTMDMKDRLEQSCSTNRTLQNYIHFLKNSYACAFNDSPHITSLSHLQDLNSRDFLAGDFVGNVGSGAGNIF